MRRRVITALIGIPIVLAILLARSWIPFATLLMAALVVGMGELRGLAASRANAGLAVAALLIPIAYGWGGGPVILALACLWACFLYGIASLLVHNDGDGAGWIAGPLATLGMIQWASLPASGGPFVANAVLLAIVPLWGGDSAAIFAGKAFGRHPMAPRISPNKTWEGGIANFLACVLVGGLLGLFLDPGVIRGVGCGAACGVFGQLGDLFESSLKRRSGIKDSGALLPGHGGVLDRIDSLLFSALPVATILFLS